MTELEVLDSNINGLKKLLKFAWKDLASPSLSPFEHREARNQIKQHSDELRRYTAANSITIDHFNARERAIFRGVQPAGSRFERLIKP